MKKELKTLKKLITAFIVGISLLHAQPDYNQIRENIVKGLVNQRNSEISKLSLKLYCVQADRTFYKTAEQVRRGIRYKKYLNESHQNIINAKKNVNNLLNQAKEYDVLYGCNLVGSKNYNNFVNYTNIYFEKFYEAH